MAKKKKNKNKNKKQSALNLLNENVDIEYERMSQEIMKFQEKIAYADKKIEKKAKKMMKRGEAYNAVEEKRKSRNLIVLQADSVGLFDRIHNFIEQTKPIVKLLCSTVKALIVSILSIDEVKKYVTPDILGKINNVMTKADTVLAAL